MLNAHSPRSASHLTADFVYTDIDLFALAQNLLETAIGFVMTTVCKLWSSLILTNQIGAKTPNDIAPKRRIKSRQNAERVVFYFGLPRRLAIRHRDEGKDSA